MSVSSIRKLASEPLLPQIVYNGEEAVNIVPYSLSIYSSFEKKKFVSFSAALDYYFSHEHREPSALDRKIASLSYIISDQETMLSQIKDDSQAFSEAGDAIYHNYAVVAEVIDELKKARKKFSWGEIQSFCIIV